MGNRYIRSNDRHSHGGGETRWDQDAVAPLAQSGRQRQGTWGQDTSDPGHYEDRDDARFDPRGDRGEMGSGPDRSGGRSGWLPRGPGVHAGWLGTFGVSNRDSRSGTSGMHPKSRGPKGWQRSDERIREDLCERLYYSHHIDSSDVSVEVSEGRVTLDGTVMDRDTKYLIEELVDECPGVTDLDNRIRVNRGSVSAGAAGPSNGTTMTEGAGGPGGSGPNVIVAPSEGNGAQSSTAAGGSGRAPRE